MDFDLFAALSFVLIATFTPGPANISSASMGILYGYRKTMGYLLGILTGFCLIMLLCGLVSSALLQLLPAVENYLRIFGALYILWLAYHTLKASYAFKEDLHIFSGFSKGFLLQMLNFKLMIYGMTLYASFLDGIAIHPLYLFLSVLALAVICFCSISIWTLFGATIRTYMKHTWIKHGFNIVLSLLLVYTAVEISGILDLINY